VKPNNTDGHGYDFQAVDIDPSLRASPSQAAVVVDDFAQLITIHLEMARVEIAVFHIPAASERHYKLSTCLIKRPSKAAGLTIPRVAIRTRVGNAITFSGPASVSSVDS
jgi:hypothetical protein